VLTRRRLSPYSDSGALSPIAGPARRLGPSLFAAFLAAGAVAYALHHSTVLLVVGAMVVGLVAWRFFVRRPAFLPLGIVAVAGLVPYSVSFVGKSPFSIISAMGAMAMLSALVLLEIRDREHDPVPIVDVIVKLQLVWLGLALASTALSGHFFRQAANTTRQWVFAMPIMYLTGKLIARRYPRALRLALWMVVVFSGLAFAERFAGFSPYHFIPRGNHFPLVDPGPSFRAGTLRVRLGFYHASDFSRMLTVAFPLLLAERARSSPPRWLTVGAFTVPGAILLTLTFQAWAGTLAALGVLLAVARRVRRSVVVGAVLVGVVGFVVGFGASIPSLVQARLQPTGSNLDERQFRLALIPAAEKYAATHAVVGAGPGTFNFLGLQAPLNGQKKPLVDDSTFAAQLVEVGYPGAIAFIVMLVGSCVVFWRRRQRGYYAVALAGLVAWVIIASAIDALADDQSLAVVWLLIGLAVGASHE